MSIFSDSFVEYGSGQKTAVGGLKDEALGAKLRRYKAAVAKRYRVLEPELVERGAIPNLGTLWISTKVDGELWFLVKKQGEVALCAYNGRVLKGAPLLKEAEKQLAKVDDIVVPGELFALNGDGRPRCQHVGRALGDGKLAETLGFKAFDLLEEAGEDKLAQPYDKRFKRLVELFDGGKRVAVVTTVEGKAEDVLTYYREWVGSQRFEGLVVRNEQGITYKIKPTFSIDAVVVAYGERLEGSVSQIRELSVALRHEDGSLHLLGTVGSGFSDEDRIQWHRRLSALQVPSSFRMANREGTLCRFVKPEIVVEIRCSDLVDTDANDAPVRRMVLNFDNAQGYSAAGAVPLASMVHPVFERERTDKVADSANIGLEQVYSRLPTDARADKVEKRDSTPSEVLKRGVYTKVTKGQTAVRKYVAIHTRKAKEDPSFPAYVVHFTDYAAGRQEPLKTSIRVASSPEKLDQHIQAWIEENVKRGWSEVKAG